VWILALLCCKHFCETWAPENSDVPTVRMLCGSRKIENILSQRSKEAIPVTGSGGPYVLSVRYEHHLHIKKVQLSS
jgi:hypothetical protein